MNKRNRTVYMRDYYQRTRNKRLAYNKVYGAWYEKTPRIKQRRAELRDLRRDFIFNTLGKVCVRCGFIDRRALQMDHIHGRNGEKRLGNIDNRYRFVRKFPDKAKEIYQILCANCNFIKMSENHEYRKAKDNSY